MTVCQLSFFKSISFYLELQISPYNVLILNKFPIVTVNLYASSLSVTEYAHSIILTLFLRKHSEVI